MTDTMAVPSLNDAMKVRSGKFKARLEDVKQHYIGRDDVVDLLGLAAVCQEHVLLIGPPGTAKSGLLDRFARMLGVGYFNYLLTRFTEPAELFGPLDLEVFKNESRYQIKTTDMLPDNEIVFLDEIFQGSSAILNTLLTLVNERTFHNGSHPTRAKLMTMLGSSNEMSDEPVLNAFSDRFLLRNNVRYVPEDDLEDLLEQGWTLERGALRHDVTRNGEAGPDVRRTEVVFGLEELRSLQQAVATIDLLPVRETMAAVARSFRSEGIRFSDRRIVKAQKVVAASALLAGRAAATTTDLAVLCNMWADPQDAESIQRIVSEHGIPVAASRSSARVTAEIRLDLQELSTRAAAVTGGPELREALGRLQKLNLEVRRDHPNEPELSRDVMKVLRGAVTRYRELHDHEGLGDV
ncbi:AAA family ATPase [Amycolatopsis sp. NPDC048633]|uniref:AAA family ATPase n=1 Tax=Amycolatopsis sp. NPDC048633 TaxID=3157095 RepID=UPI0033F3CAA6